MHKSQSLFNLTTVGGGNRYTVLLSAAIVEELEPV
jgi:hypothetical protein